MFDFSIENELLLFDFLSRAINFPSIFELLNSRRSVRAAMLEGQIAWTDKLTERTTRLNTDKSTYDEQIVWTDENGNFNLFCLIHI